MSEPHQNGPSASTLDQVAALGPFFTVRTHRTDSAPAPPWRPMSEVIDDPSVLLRRVHDVHNYLVGGRSPNLVGDRSPDLVTGQSLDAVDLRIAASVTHLGLTARLISPALAIAVFDDVWPSMDLRYARWQPVPGGAFPLSLANEAFTPVSPDEFLDGPMRSLVEAIQPLSVSSKILWGNIASAVNGAANVLATARPDTAHRTRSLATLLLSQPALANTWNARPNFQRRSCCLIYRASSSGLRAICGDCVLAHS